MSGLPDIDVDDWEKNTEYSGSYDPDTPIIKVRGGGREGGSAVLMQVVASSCSPFPSAFPLFFPSSLPLFPSFQWFWEVVHSYNEKDLAILLQFVTGR